MIRKLVLAATAVVLSASATACTIHAETPDLVIEDSSSDSTLVVQWSIDGITDDEDCFRADAQKIQISIDDMDGIEVGTYLRSCSAFETSISLPPGRYEAFAVMLDGDGRPRTTEVEVDPFRLYGDDSLTIPLDFPLDSFF